MTVSAIYTKFHRFWIASQPLKHLSVFQLNMYVSQSTMMMQAVISYLLRETESCSFEFTGIEYEQQQPIEEDLNFYLATKKERSSNNR